MAVTKSHLIRPIVFRQYVREAIEAATEKLNRRLHKKGYGAFVSKHEILGILTEEYKELIDAVQSEPVNGGRNSVRAELLDIVVGCLFGVASIDCGAVPCEKSSALRQDEKVAA